VNENAPRWLQVLLAEHGVKETPGPKSTPRIDLYHAATSGGVPPQGDETSWCSSACCFAMEQSHVRSTRSKAAISWLTWGVGIQVPRLGCVTVLHREDPRNPNAAHVALWLATIGDRVVLLGGNQGNAVSIVPYAAARVMAFRVPMGDL